MKIESMRTRSYRSFKVDDADLPAEAQDDEAQQVRHHRGEHVEVLVGGVVIHGDAR